jgi:hypothetical protein
LDDISEQRLVALLLFGLPFPSRFSLLLPIHSECTTKARTSTNRAAGRGVSGKRGGALVFETPGVTIEPEAIGQAVAEERESR